MTNQCGLYGRVSTVGLGQDPKQQIDVLKSVCEQKSWNIFGEYVDYCPGAKSRRPELDNLIQDCISKRLTLSFVGVLIGSVEMQNISSQLMNFNHSFFIFTNNK